ncbi:MAG TPA: chromate transporter, partial [Methyloceanibacter sp.]
APPVGRTRGACRGERRRDRASDCAFYDPIWIVGITSAADFALAIAAFLLLIVWQTPPWLVVLLSALAGGIMRSM